FFQNPVPTETYTLSLHDALPISFATPDLSSFILQAQASKAKIIGIAAGPPNNMNEIKTAAEFGLLKGGQQMAALLAALEQAEFRDRKSTRLNSSHDQISYAVFCL